MSVPSKPTSPLRGAAADPGRLGVRKDMTLRVSTDKAELDVPLIHRFLSEHSGWAKGISLPVVEQALEHSLCFGGFLGATQVAFARVISDYATFANLVDVFVLPEHRGRGYSKTIMAAVVAHPQLQGLRRFTSLQQMHMACIRSSGSRR